MDGQDWKAAHQAQVAKDRKTDRAVKELDIASLKLAALVVDDGIIQAGLLEAVLKELTSLLAARIGADKSPLPPCWNDVLKSDQSGGAEIIRELLAVNGLKPELRSGLLLAFKTQWAKEQRESARDFGAIWEAITSDGESSETSTSPNSILGMLSSRGFSEDEATRLLDKCRELVELENPDDPSTAAKIEADRVRRLHEFHDATQSEEWLKFFESLSLKRVTLLCSALRGQATDQDLGELLNEPMVAELRQLGPLLGGYLDFLNSEIPKSELKTRQAAASARLRQPKGKRRGKNKTGMDALTPRQTEVYAKVEECGGNFSEAARRLGRNESTVREHYQAALKKLGKLAVEKPRTGMLPNDRRGGETLSEKDDARRG